MLAWVDAAHTRFNTKQLKAEAREGKHFAKELVHEARPMALFAYRYFSASPQVIIAAIKIMMALSRIDESGPRRSGISRPPRR